MGRLTSVAAAFILVSAFAGAANATQTASDAPARAQSRGVQLAGQFRYLSSNSHGQIDTTFLPNDSQAHGDRSYLHFTDITDFKRGMRFDADIANVFGGNWIRLLRRALPE